jgi:cold shock protein
MGRKTSAALKPDNTRDYDKECKQLFKELQEKRAIKQGVKKGIVLTFNVKCGTGYIKPVAGGENLFVHHNDITGSGFKLLKPGQQVSYYENQNNKRKYAAGVKVIS